MFKKGPDIDKKKLLAKASDVKKDSLTRLKHFKTLIEHMDSNETHSLFRSHFSFIYSTFIDTFSTFDCNSQQRSDDLECILYVFEKIIIYNPEVVHELFRQAFLNFNQPALMKRVVNVYKEWICNGGPNQNNNAHGRNLKIGYTSFNDLLQVFILNSSNAFLTQVQSSTMLDEQFEMCKRIMNIYRYMVMKIYMNTPTWEQLLNVMLLITEQLFPHSPPEKKENTIGGRIAPAFFQTFIVSWIRANLYVHISPQMWYKFHRVMKGLVEWRELIEEWSTTMGSLTRVLVKHVYGLNLTDLPLDRPQEQRRRPKTLKSFSTVEPNVQMSPSGTGTVSNVITSRGLPGQRQSRSASVRFSNDGPLDLSRSLIRSNSDGIIFHNHNLYHSAGISNGSISTAKKIRKIKSDYLTLASEPSETVCLRSDDKSLFNNDALDVASLKNSIIMEHDQPFYSHQSNKSLLDLSNDQKTPNRQPESRASSEKCVLMGGTIRGWTPENSIIMWRRMLGLFGNINHFENHENHLIAVKCLGTIINDFIKTRENLGVKSDNQGSPKYPNLIPPYSYPLAWLLEVTHLPRQYRKSKLLAYKLLCVMSIRRHDTELSHQHLTAFYEAIHRGLSSPDANLHAVIIASSTQLLSLELPGCTFLVQDLYERSRSLLLNPANLTSKEREVGIKVSSRDQAVQTMNILLALGKPIRKLMVLKSDLNNSMNLVAPGDLRSKIFDTLLACNVQPIVLDSQARSKSMSSLAIHVYHELSDRGDTSDAEKLIDILLTDMQDPSNGLVFRINCDLLRLLSDHANTLASERPALISSLIQIVCQLIVRFSSQDSNKECIQCLILCLEDWCMAVNKNFLLRPVDELSLGSREDDTSSNGNHDSLITIVLRSLESVIYDEQFVDDSGTKGNSASTHTSKNSDGSNQSQGKNSSSDGSQRDRTLTNAENLQSSARLKQLNQTVQQRQNEAPQTRTLTVIKLACKVSHLKLVTYIGHYPLRQVGPASMSCCVNEFDYLLSSGIGEQQLNEADIKNSGSIFLLFDEESTIVSFVAAARNHDGLYQPVHVIIRNLCGKYSWSASCIELNTNTKHMASSKEDDIVMYDPESFHEIHARNSMKYDSDFNDDCNSTSSLCSRTSSNRDCISDLLIQLSNNMVPSIGSYSSCSSQNIQRSKRNSAHSISNPKLRVAQAEESMIALLTNQRFQELNHSEKSSENDRTMFQLVDEDVCAKIYQSIDDISVQNLSLTSNLMAGQEENLLSFEQCRQLVQQLGYLSWEKRCKVDSLAKSARLLRELKNLDNQPGRETHKIAVIYVALGQEDKSSILMNSIGSKLFEDFVAGLGWEVNLTSHLGFKGGLQSNKSTGEASTYYCSGTTEVMFHVSTRIPINKSPDDESLNRKLRHLGNDEIHIVWSEHSRDYRRGIIPTEFGDVIIAIYPMLTFQGFYRIQISSKQDVPMFGPLFDNCVVHQTILAPLVRATAINASRAKRSNLPYYQSHFEERRRLIDTIVQNHREKLSFEEFAAQLYGASELKTIPSSQSSNTVPSGQPIVSTQQ